MKLRIRGNSLRLRLTQSEVLRMADIGEVSETIRFSTDSRLSYVLRAVEGVDSPTARFEPNRIVVDVPAATARDWAKSDRVSIAGERRINADTSLALLIEKDFACLSPREDEDESDMFEHPDAASGKTC